MLSPQERQFYDYARGLDVNDSKIRPLTKLLTYMLGRFHERKEHNPDQDWSKREVALIMRDSISNQSIRVNQERDALIA